MAEVGLDMASSEIHERRGIAAWAYENYYRHGRAKSRNYLQQLEGLELSTGYIHGRGSAGTLRRPEAAAGCSSWFSLDTVTSVQGRLTTGLRRRSLTGLGLCRAGHTGVPSPVSQTGLDVYLT